MTDGRTQSDRNSYASFTSRAKNHTKSLVQPQAVAEKIIQLQSDEQIQLCYHIDVHVHVVRL